jgi:hypothetical protein
MTPTAAKWPTRPAQQLAELLIEEALIHDLCTSTHMFAVRLISTHCDIVTPLVCRTLTWPLGSGQPTAPAASSTEQGRVPLAGGLTGSVYEPTWQAQP